MERGIFTVDSDAAPRDQIDESAFLLFQMLFDGS